MSKLDGIKAGDRVRVMFEGVVTDLAPVLGVVISRKLGPTRFGGEDILDPTFQITRIEPSFKVGDRVKGLYGAESEIVAILKDGRIVIEYDAGDETAVTARDPSCFVHA